MSAPIIDLATLPALPLDERKDLPGIPAVYFVLADETVLFIGKAVSLNQRWAAQHRLS